MDAESLLESVDQLSMALFAARILELRNWMGQSQRQLSETLSLSKGVVQQWENKHAAANRDQAVRISKRYGVSLDSLYGLDQEERLQPSPNLRDAQLELRDKVLSRDFVLPTESLRIQAIGQLLIDVKAISPEGWNDWLQVDEAGWLAITQGKRIPLEPQIRGAAMLAGWYDSSEAWENWIRTGDSEELLAYEKEDLAQLFAQAAASGISAYRLRSLLKAITK
jgi:transcriptional regulator with XRE-family HTH domain